MAKIIPFPEAQSKTSSIVEEILETRLTHSNPAVLGCLKKELRILVEKYFNVEEFTSTLILPSDLNEKQFRTIEDNFLQLFKEHNDQIAKRTNAMFLDLCLAQMNICELRHRDTPPERQTFSPRTGKEND